jgi:histidyl-tRNA synthetase
VQIARSLRSAGCSVESGLDAKLKRSLELANKMNARFALIVGEDEIAAGRYTLKNMQSGEQQTVSGDELIQRMK